MSPLCYVWLKNTFRNLIHALKPKSYYRNSPKLPWNFQETEVRDLCRTSAVSLGQSHTMDNGSGSFISSEWQFTGVSKAGLSSTSWTAATPHRTLPVVSDFDLPAATISSYHDIVAARSAVGPFSVAGPMAWNALPDDIRDQSLSADNFRKTLKTHLFRNALGHLAH